MALKNYAENDMETYSAQSVAIRKKGHSKRSCTVNNNSMDFAPQKNIYIQSNCIFNCTYSSGANFRVCKN